MQTVGRAHMAVAAMWREVSPAVTGLLGEASWDASELLIGVYSTFAIEFTVPGPGRTVILYGFTVHFDRFRSSTASDRGIGMNLPNGAGWLVT